MLLVSQRIREARKTAGITQDGLAQALGVNRATISKYETGAIDLPMSQLQRIADALGVHVMDLLGVGEELDAYKPKVEFSSSSPEARPLVDFLNSSDIRTIYNSLSAEEQEELLSKSGLVPTPEPPEAGDPPQSEPLSEYEILEQIKSVYGEATGDTFSMYVRLDAGDQGEIRGEIKQMLKQGKYLKQEGNLA